MIDIRAHRQKMTGNEPDAKAILPKPRSVQKANSYQFNRLHRIEMQEDIWFFCLDSLKWDTKKIVCDKAYLQETDLLSSIHIEKLNELNRPLDASKVSK